MAKRLFISYSHADARLLERLHKHLAQLKREGSVSEWYDREITAGGHIDAEIGDQLAAADIFMAALSPDFIASAYCYEVELQRALEREERGDLIIVPVIFEPCDWLATPLGKFKALPEDGKPVSEFTNENAALLGVTSELRRLISKSKRPIKVKGSNVAPDTFPVLADVRSRYRIKRDYDQIDKRDYVERAFNEIKRFFEASAAEIRSVPELEAEFTERSSDVFSCTVINRGLRRSLETIHVRRGGSFGDIDVVYGERPAENTSNGGFYAKSDEYEMYLSSSFFRSMGHGDDHKRLTPSDAARLLWDDLLSRVGVDYA
jgi:hypothetical protein